MSVTNKKLSERLIEEFWNQGNMALADELIASDFVNYDPLNPVRGPRGYQDLALKYRSAFPDLRFTIDDLIADGDMVAIRYTCTGTHEGKFEGIAPTGKQVTVTGITMSRIAKGKVVASWVNWDALGLMQQLGVVPAATHG